MHNFYVQWYTTKGLQNTYYYNYNTIQIKYYKRFVLKRATYVQLYWYKILKQSQLRLFDFPCEKSLDNKRQSATQWEDGKIDQYLKACGCVQDFKVRATS